MGVRNEIISQVEAFVAAMGRTSIKQVQTELRLTQDQAKDALFKLMERGRVIRPEYGVYAWVGNSGLSGAAVNRCWHAMTINPTWTLDDIARQAGTTVNYVRRCLVSWKKEGLVEQFGRQPSPAGGYCGVYRCTAKAKQYPNPSVSAPWAPDALTIDAVDLVRLLATGRASRFPEDHAKALALCEQIARELKQSAPNT